MNRLRQRLPGNEQGQSIVLVALLLSLAFLVFAALAIDGTILYLRRRQLQNIADAAALAAAVELSQHKNETAAYAVAMDTITANEGRIEWYSTNSTPNPPTTNVGSGVNLVLGIQITNACDVRVALRWSDIGTYFAQFVGREKLQVGANAHAGCNRAGGLQPIAVKRFGDQFDWDTTPGLNASNATIYCEDCTTQTSLPGPPAQGNGNAYDFLKPAGLDVITTWPTGTLIYQSPSPMADLDGGSPGRDYFILGNGTNPNVGTVSYAGLVNLDIRSVSSSPQYFNGVDAGTNSDTLKDLGEYYIRRGYCCDIPSPGDQVAIYNGGSTAFASMAFQETYVISDIVAVIVYNGHVYASPSLEMTGDPTYQVTYPTTTTLTSQVYTLTLEAKDGFRSAASGLNMSVTGLEGFANWSLSSTAPVFGWDGYPVMDTLNLTITPITTTVATTTQVITGNRMFYVKANDSNMGGTKIIRYWAGVATFGAPVATVQPAVSALPTNSDGNYPLVTVVRGQQGTYSIDLDIWGFSADQTVSISAGALPTGFSWVQAPPWTNNVKWNKHPGTSFNVKFKTDDTAVPTDPDDPLSISSIPLTVSIPGNPSVAAQTFNLYVIVQEAPPVVKEYVEILGYAALQVTGYPNINAVRGRIISELMDDPSKLKYGLRARLIPWEP